jgi:hypothetical protein
LRIADDYLGEQLVRAALALANLDADPDAAIVSGTAIGGGG